MIATYDRHIRIMLFRNYSTRGWFWGNLEMTSREIPQRKRFSIYNELKNHSRQLVASESFRKSKQILEIFILFAQSIAIYNAKITIDRKPIKEYQLKLRNQTIFNARAIEAIECFNQQKSDYPRLKIFMRRKILAGRFSSNCHFLIYSLSHAGSFSCSYSEEK